MNNNRGAATPRILAEHDRRPHASAAELARALGLTRNQVIGVLHRHRPGWSQRGRDRRNWAQNRAAGPAAGNCRFLIDGGDGIRDPAATWCCEPAVPGKNWCAAHCQVVFRKPTPGEEAAVGGRAA